jgi:hypothetical protein
MRLLERFSNSRTLANSVQGGFYFHPTDDDQSVGTSDGKRPLECKVSADSIPKILYAVARCSWPPRRTLTTFETPGSCMVTP